MTGNRTPEKPDKQKDQISELWDAVYNHIPTHLRWLNIKTNFILAMMGVVLALITASIVIAVST